MKTRILQLAIVLLGCSSLFLATSCQNPPSGTPSTFTIGNAVSDLTLAGSVAAQYEAAAKSGKVTPDKLVAIAKSAVDQYAASQPSATATQVQQWLAIASDLVAVYDAAHGVK